MAWSFFIFFLNHFFNIGINIEDYYHKLTEKKLGKKSLLRSTFIRGLIFLILAVIVTYYGKCRPHYQNIVNKHCLNGWIFKQNSHFSVFIILPNDGDYSNRFGTGERIFINPLQEPHFLDSNYIIYNQKDLYLLGAFNHTHIEQYGKKVDTTSLLFYWGKKLDHKKMPNVQHLPFQNTYTFKDKNTKVQVNFDSLSNHYSLSIWNKGQILIFSNQKRSSLNIDSSTMIVYTKEGMDINIPRHGLVLSPTNALNNGKTDSSLILTKQNQALAFRVTEKGTLTIKKLWLKKSLLANN